VLNGIGLCLYVSGMCSIRCDGQDHGILCKIQLKFCE